MNIFHYERKGKMFDTLEKFYNYRETKEKQEPDKRQTHRTEQHDIRNNSETFPSRRAAHTKRVWTPKNDTHKDSTQDSYPSGRTDVTTR